MDRETARGEWNAGDRGASALERYPRNGMQRNGTGMGTGGTRGRPPLTSDGVADAARAWHVDGVGGFVDKALPNGSQARGAGGGWLRLSPGNGSVMGLTG